MRSQRLPKLTIALLGPPRIERDGAPLNVDTRKAIALLAYLAVGTAEGASRGSLAALFWPDVDQARAYAALRRTLSTLNKALAGNSLRIDRETVALVRGEQVWIDTAEFEAKLAVCRTHGHSAQAVCDRCLTPLAEAAALYRDDFMSGFTLRDSPGFDDWQFFQSEGRRRMLASVLERLAAGHTHRGELDLAATHARRWLALDPLHEPAHRRLMELYAWTNQRSAALRQYQDCMRVLDHELGVPPLDETTQLYNAIKENRLPGPATSVAVTAPPVSPVPPAVGSAAERELPLVGRASEWDSLLAAYRAIGPDGRLVVLEGEAGIGKSRLADTALQSLRQQGTVTLLARCYEGELNLAYGPFVEGLRAALRHAPDSQARVAALAPHWLGEAARLLPELQALRPDLPPIPASDSPGAQSRFFEAVRQLLLSALAHPSQPGVLLIDDAQWIDEASLDLLTYLVRRLRGHPVCLLVTWRGEQLPAGHRLRHLLAEALRAGLAVNIFLRRLTLAAVTELAEAMLPNTATEARALVHRLYQETEGLPFFVVEYLTSLANAAERGDTEPWVLPASVRHLLEARLTTVDETALQLLHTAAVIGRSFELDTLQAASGRGDDETVLGLEALIAAGLVNEVHRPATASAANQPAPTYDFSHEKLRSLVYERTSLARRRLLHRRVAEALIARSRRHVDAAASQAAGQVAIHYQLAGHEREAADYFRLAGDHARTLYANGEALAHYQSALALGHPDAAALHTAIGDLQTLQGDYTAALASYAEAVVAFGPQASAESRAALAHKFGNVYLRRGDWALAEEHFEMSLQTLSTEASAGTQARVYADWSLAAHHQGRAEHAQDLAQKGLALAATYGDPRALAQAHNILGILASSREDLPEARRHLERSLALAEAHGDPGARAAALNNLAIAYGNHNQYEPALRLTEEALALCKALGDRHREAALLSHLADLLHATGQTEAAMLHLKQSVMIYTEIGPQAGALQPAIWKLAEW